MQRLIVRGTIRQARRDDERVGWRTTWISPIRYQVGGVVDGVEITAVQDDTDDGLYKNFTAEDKQHNRALLQESIVAQ